MSDNQNDIKLDLSHHQFCTLRYINDHVLTMHHLRLAHATTLGSLAYRGYLRKVGSGEGAQIMLTDAGLQALHGYSEDRFNARSREGDLTERCQRLILHSRRMGIVAKGAA